MHPNPRELDSPTPEPTSESPESPAPITPEFQKPPALPGSHDSFRTVTDEEARRIWQFMQDTSERLTELEKERRRDLRRSLELESSVEELNAGIKSAAEAFSDLRRDQRQVNKRLNASVQEDLVTARHLAEVELRLSKMADLAGSESGGRAGRSAGRRTASKWGGAIGALMIVLEIARVIYASHEAPKPAPPPTSTGWTKR